MSCSFISFYLLEFSRYVRELENFGEFLFENFVIRIQNLFALISVWFEHCSLEFVYGHVIYLGLAEWT